MTSREIVTRAIEFQRPDRLPVRFAALGVDDTYFVDLGKAAGYEPVAPGADQWGCIWERPDPASGISNVGQVTGHPLVDLSRLDDITWPDPHDDARYVMTEEALRGAGDKYVLSAVWFVFFERMHFLRGMTQLLMDMHEEPARVHELAERVIEYPIQVAHELGRRFPGRIHGLLMTDDWGTQESTFIGLPMWREFFKERYRRLFTALHEAGLHAWVHSCGHVNDIVGEWIDCGLDVVNLQQPRNLGIEEIGRRYRGRICFESLCDIQATLPTATDQEVREEAALLLQHWATPEGGFILSDYEDGEAIGVSLERKRVMLEEFQRLTG